MAGIGAALSLFQGYSNYQSQKSAIQAQADSQASMYRAQAQAAEHNAQMESRRQEQIADQYGAEQRKLRDKQRIAAASIRAGAGAAGLDSSTGSPFDIQTSGQEAYWQDQMTLLGNQRNDNYESRVTESNYRTRAKNNQIAARNVLDDADRQIGALGLTSILGTAMSMTPFLSGVGGGSNSGTTSASGSGSGWGGSGWNNPYVFNGPSGSKNFGLRFGG
jgi:hypothetical protein